LAFRALSQVGSRQTLRVERPLANHLANQLDCRPLNQLESQPIFPVLNHLNSQLRSLHDSRQLLLQICPQDGRAHSPVRNLKFSHRSSHLVNHRSNQ
jgi:hypothetical protein